MARLVLGNTDASGAGRGWIAPTATQPRFASFFLGGSAGTNMAHSGIDAMSVGTPALHPGEQGKQLPYLATKGGVDYLRTGVTEPKEGTFFSIARMPDPPRNEGNDNSDGVLMGAYGGIDGGKGNMMMILTASSAPSGAFRARMPEKQPSGWNVAPPVIADMKSWGLYAFRYRIIGSGLEGMARTYTCNATASRIGVPADAVAPSSIEIGSQPNADTTMSQRGIVHHAAAMIWDVALSDAEMEAVASLLRRWCARYGVTV